MSAATALRAALRRVTAGRLRGTLAQRGGFRITVDPTVRATLEGQGHGRTMQDKIRRVFKERWRAKWREVFHRRWYSLVTRRSGDSGAGFAVRRGGGGWLDYRLVNLEDYAYHVHRAGKKTPIMQTAEFQSWVDEYAADVSDRLGKIAREHTAKRLRVALQAAAGRRVLNLRT